MAQSPVKSAGCAARNDYLLVLLAACALSVPFFGMPPHVDAGYYGYLARAVAAGFRLHADMPAAQNSLGFYAHALAFKIFGSGLVVLRGVCLLFLLGFAASFLALARRALSRGAALVATLLSLVYVCQPQIQRGFGRNHLLAVLFFITAGVYCALTAETKKRLALAGFLTGLAVCFNESFLFCCAAPVLYAALYYPAQRVRAVWSAVSGTLAAFAVPAILLTVWGQWPGYIADMAHMGAGARLSGAYSSRVANLFFVSWDFVVVYLAALALYRPWVRQDRSALENRLAGVFMPFLAVTVLFVNTVREYHLQVLLPFVTLGAVSTFCLYLRKLRGENSAMSAVAVVKAGFALPDKTLKNYSRALVLCAGFAVVNAAALTYDYASALRQSLACAPRYLLGAKDGCGDPVARLTDIAAALPHENMATMSQYQLLYLDPVLSVTRPPVEDLTLSGNSGGYIPLSELTGALRQNPSDLYIGYRFADGPSYEIDFLESFLRGRYIQLADWRRPAASYVPLRWRLTDPDGVPNAGFDDIYYSTAAFARNFEPVETVALAVSSMTVAGTRAYTLDLRPFMPAGARFLIAEVFFPRGGAYSASMVSGYNSVSMGNKPLVEGRFYCAMRAETGGTLSLFSARTDTPVLLTFHVPRR